MYNRFSFIRRVLFITGFLLISAKAYSQEIYFCEGVDDDGYPKSEATTFTIPDDGGYLYFLVRMDEECNSYSMEFVLYTVDRNGEETYSTTISMDTEPDWTYFWKKVTFYKAGRYKIYVYDDSDNLLTSGIVKIKYN